jgi:hypothetical protein
LPEPFTHFSDKDRKQLGLNWRQLIITKHSSEAAAQGTRFDKKLGES